jgi:glycosyltransferase involved in cell wall biosynthesis
MRPTVILLSFNSEDALGATISSARRVSDEIFVVDSFSKDGTVELARSFGATVVEHAFEHYGAQRNWAIDNLPISKPWQLHLDADEWMDDELVAAILALPEEPEHAGYFLPRYLRFLGRVLRHGGMSPTWHLRLFRTGVGRCEDRKYDQHFLLTSGTSGQLRGTMIDDIRMPLTEWIARHNRWADGEVAELESNETSGRLQPDARGNPAQRKRYLRQKYNRMPLFVRPLYPCLCIAISSGWAFSTEPRASSSGSCKHSGSVFSWMPKSGRSAMLHSLSQSAPLPSTRD